MKQSEKEAKESNELEEKVSKKSFFRQRNIQVYQNEMLGEQKDMIRPLEFSSFAKMLKLIPDVRRQVPKSDCDSLLRLQSEYQKNVENSTLITIPVSFFMFFNQYTRNRIGKAGTWILSISCTAMITMANIILFQQIFNSSKIERMEIICSLYKPIIRDPFNIDFISFMHNQIFCHPLLLDDSVADRTFKLSKELYDKSKLGPIPSEVRYKFRDEINKISQERKNLLS